MEKEVLIYQVWLLGLDQDGTWMGYDFLIADCNKDKSQADLIFSHLTTSNKKLSESIKEVNPEFTVPNEEDIEEYCIQIEEVVCDEEENEELETEVIADYTISKEEF